MRGHVYRRGSTWTYVVDRGDRPDGSRRQTSKGGYRTRKEAEAALAQTITRLQDGTYVDPRRLTVGSYLTAHWLPAVRAGVRPLTFSSYEMHVRRHLVPGLGRHPLQQLAPPAINAFYAGLAAPNDERSPLSAASIRRIHATLHRALADAVRWQVLARNPASAADPPRAPRPKKRAWSAEELRAFLSHVGGHEWAALWHFVAMTGVRRGEALGVRREDVDFARGRVAIAQTVIPLRSGTAWGEPKTAKGRRAIAIDPTTAAALRAQRTRQLEERLLVGSQYEDHGLVFARADGRPLNPEHVTRVFSSLVRKSGLKPITLHGLRHTHATLALVEGINTLVVSERLGHSSMAVTAELYQEVTPNIEDDAARRIAAAVLEVREEPDAALSELRR
jgi:integrase